MPDRPFLSVITVSYNSAKTIGRTLQSLSDQTDKDFESIVIDGESVDSTLSIVRSFQDSILISEADSGIYDAMNKGIAKARGKYVAFLNSDDSYLSETVEKVKAFALKTNAQIIYGNIQKERALGNEVLTRVETPNLELMPKTMGVFHPSTFVKRGLFKTLGIYDQRFKQAADYQWFLRAYLNKVEFRYLDEVLVKFSLGGVSNNSCETYREAAIIQKELNTGHHKEMEHLHQVCLSKQKRGELILKIASWPLVRKIYRRKIRKRWS
ncbi:MAG: glycosyltransferase [Flavobacteriales bacterium]|nr:glycosyltransferase [Flavobacteriales bacterium]